MANAFITLRCICHNILFLSIFSSFLFLYLSYYFSIACRSQFNLPLVPTNPDKIISLLTFPSAWNHLDLLLSKPPPRLLKIALFVKKWPDKRHAGGLERHASTLHLRLTKRGHQIHVFTSSSLSSKDGNFSSTTAGLYFHLSKPTAAGYLDQATVWKQFEAENSPGRSFDVVHTESVALMHTRARNLSNLVVSWHGIAYESIHSDIIQESLRAPDEANSPVLMQRVVKVVEEIKFFPRYAHHVATSDHVGDVLKRIYMLPEERVHVILNGVDEDVFKPQGHDIRESNSLVLGIAGRLVKDKGHPLIFEALQQISNENSTFRDAVVVLVAGDGPWGQRYKELGSNVHVLGPLDRAQLARFYNSIDVFVNPTLRAQGLDHTLLEAMLVGKPLMATRLASIEGSVILSQDIGYTFSPTVEALKKALYRVWEDGKDVLQQKGQMARKRALRLFTASKMAAAYERLFLCIDAKHRDASSDDCIYRQT